MYYPRKQQQQTHKQQQQEREWQQEMTSPHPKLNTTQNKQSKMLTTTHAFLTVSAFQKDIEAHCM